jgi:hypothetical protein
MQFSINRAKAFAAIAIVLLMSSITLMTMQVQPVKAQSAQEIIVHGTDMTTPGVPNLGPLPSGVTPAYTYESRAYLSFRPNPIGVGQSLLVNVWTTPGMYHAFYMQGYKVTIQKPDGTTIIAGPFNSYMGDATGWFEFVPDQAGTWKLKFESPGTYMPAGSYVDSPTGQAFMQVGTFNLGASVYYTADSTDWQELTVQQDMVSSWPPSALPTDYWTRPANTMNREWWPILGNYPFSGAYYYEGGRVLYASSYKYTAYVQAPNSAHIVWKRQGAISGIVGGEEYYYSIGSGGGTPTIIYAGRCYQAVTKAKDGQSASFFQCYDLRTGEVYWEQAAASTTMSYFGMVFTVGLAPTNILYEKSIPEAVPGAEAMRSYTISLAAVSGNRLYKWDPWTGALSLNVSISPISGGTIVDNEWVLSVQTINATAGNYRLINWTMAGTTTNFTARIGSNITWPRTWSQMAYDLDAGIALYCWWASPPGPHWCIGHEIQAIDLKTGAVLWYSMNNDTVTENLQGSAYIANRGKFAIGTHGMVWTCWDARTGKKLWTSEKAAYPWGSWWPYNMASYDFNESKSAIITSTYEGVYAIDWDTGKILWHYVDANSVPFENPYDATPYFTGVTIADGKVYAYNGEHSTTQPMSRDWKLHCINATTGELIWKILNPMTPGAVADGYLTASNPFDGYMYVFGKGKSQTTVTAPQTSVPLGTKVLIEGTVLDQSPAQPSTPCVSKESMSTQMEYLHLQMPVDGLWHNETINGVPVILTAIGSDGTVIDIGTTTTNGYYGAFGYAWAPPKEDTYTIMASFAGDDSYGSSTAATFLLVGPAPASPTPTPTEQPQAAPDNTPTIIGMGIAIIIAIAIVGILMLRKRP